MYGPGRVPLRSRVTNLATESFPFQTQKPSGSYVDRIIVHVRPLRHVCESLTFSFVSSLIPMSLGTVSQGTGLFEPFAHRRGQLTRNETVKTVFNVGPLD